GSAIRSAIYWLAIMPFVQICACRQAFYVVYSIGNKIGINDHKNRQQNNSFLLMQPVAIFQICIQPARIDGCHRASRMLHERTGRRVGPRKNLLMNGALSSGQSMPNSFQHVSVPSFAKPQVRSAYSVAASQSPYLLGRLPLWRKSHVQSVPSASSAVSCHSPLNATQSDLAPTRSAFGCRPGRASSLKI